MDPIASNEVASSRQRQQLQQLFDRALRWKDGDRDDLLLACELFRQCFATDPGNLIYAQYWLAAIEKLAHASNRGRRPVRFFHRWAVRGARRRRDWPRVIEISSRCLTSDATNLDWLVRLADACDNLGFEMINILLLRHAARLHAGNDQVFRQLANALTRIGDFNQARRCWHHVHELCPGDQQAVAELTKLGESTARAEPVGSPSAEPVASVNEYVEQVESLIAAGRFDRAEQVLSRAISQLGSDIRLSELAEKLPIDLVRFELGIAQQRLVEHPSAENERLVERLRCELNRREIDFYATVTARYPQQLDLKLELGVRLKHAGIFAEAISEFAKILHHPEMGPIAMVETGECWQNLRQYDRALGFYRDAMKSNSLADEELRRAQYRAAILLEAMGNWQQAQQLFTELLQADPQYKDAAARLDKIQQIHQDM